LCAAHTTSFFAGKDVSCGYFSRGFIGAMKVELWSVRELCSFSNVNEELGKIKLVNEADEQSFRALQ
jgi:hypothetical protein